MSLLASSEPESVVPLRVVYVSYLAGSQQCKMWTSRVISHHFSIFHFAVVPLLTCYEGPKISGFLYCQPKPELKARIMVIISSSVLCPCSCQIIGMSQSTGENVFNVWHLYSVEASPGWAVSKCHLSLWQSCQCCKVVTFLHIWKEFYAYVVIPIHTFPVKY